MAELIADNTSIPVVTHWHEATVAPEYCPRCLDLFGVPYRAGSIHGQVYVVVRCTTCHHEWQVEQRHRWGGHVVKSADQVTS